MGEFTIDQQCLSKLEPRTIDELSQSGYRFRIPSYQRGYRWERQQVEQLLNDIAESDVKTDPDDKISYYLQPIVVAPAPDEYKLKFDYDLIDGQQRLTTIYLILKALDKLKTKPSDNEIISIIQRGEKNITDILGLVSTLSRFDFSCNFHITYQTRISSEIFIRDIAIIDKSNPQITVAPDHLYMWHAFQAVIQWIKSQPIEKVSKVAGVIKTKVKIIWYELPKTITDWKKFTDLNIGKIPLTNSELIKALFLRSKKFTDESDDESEEYQKQTMIAQWDEIERELSDSSFWGFLTRENPDVYPTKIDLLFDLFSEKKISGSHDKLYTFNYFVEWFKTNPNMTGQKKWEEIYLQYQRLRDWYANRHMYHRIGYLIAIDYPENALNRLFKFAHPSKKGRENRSTDRINDILDRLIKMSLKIQFEGIDNFRDLKYNASDDPEHKIDTKHHKLIKRYLTLYNIMMTESAGESLRYPFSCHNSVKGGWSLEHIHAQNSQTLNKAWQWHEWIKNHKASLERITKTYNGEPELTKNIQNLINIMISFEGHETRDRFNEIAEDYRYIMEQLPGASGLYQDEIANLALLGRNDNSTLNNSTFDVKRQKITNMLGTNFVPIATERIFLKAINGEIKRANEKGEYVSVAYACDTDHIFFWGKDDRDAYMNDMEVKLAKYL